MHLPRPIQRAFDLLIPELRRIADAVGVLHADAQQQIKAANAAQERHHKQQEIAPLWLNDVIAKYEETEGNKAANDNRHYRVQNSIRWATWCAFIAASVYGGIAALQLRTMRTTYKEIERQTKAAQNAAYATCLNAQAAQETFIQIQRNTGDSHAAAMATITQAASGIEAERALISVIPRFPKTEELYNQQLVIPYSIRNDGKSAATDSHIKITAVMVSAKDAFPSGNKDFVKLDGSYIPAGAEIPDKPTDAEHRALTVFKTVHDTKGQTIAASSQQTRDFLEGGPGVVLFYGSMEYSDFSGVHNDKFCNAMFMTKPGGFHVPGKAEIRCAKDNRRDDKYSKLPKAVTLPPMDATQHRPINCTEPRDY